MTKAPKRRKRPLVVHTDGSRHPLLRGMLTHGLVRRGVEFDDAYAVARAVASDLSGRSEVETAELRDLVEDRLARTIGKKELQLLRSPIPSPSLQVVYDGDAQPFSRGVLAQSLYASGLDYDRAYALVLDLQAELVGEGVRRIVTEDLGRRAGELLERREGRTTASRYRLIRSIQRLPRPLVLYIGGATGTGKSTLAVTLAPLLRVYRINSTDTIRQVMRMVFSPAILPALHRSSFELDGPDTQAEVVQAEEDGPEALVRAFEEQAVSVCVGVRAVVERSIAENSHIVLEGVHLLPTIVPFADLEGVCYQQMVMLSTIEEETHRSHLAARRSLRERRPRRYLRSFEAIRQQQQHLLTMAEEHDVPLLDTGDRDHLVPRAVQLVTELLERRWPALGLDELLARPTIPALLLIVDGMPDRPVRELGSRTPLQAAATPNLDRLAAEGRVGLADPVAPGVVPDTASGNLALFGQPPDIMRRGPIEAVGAGLDLEPGDVALRGNLATIDERGWVLDRRAGRIRDDVVELARSLQKMAREVKELKGIEIRIRPGTEHRLAVVLRAPGLSSAIVGSDPGEAAIPAPARLPSAKDPGDEAAVRTARAVAIFEASARELLERHEVNGRRRKAGLPIANAVLTRGAGHPHQLNVLEPGGSALRVACVAGDRTVTGIASLLGAEIFREPEMTASLDSDLYRKLRVARKALREHDLVVVHVKGADIASHDRRPDLKVDFLARLDEELGTFLDAWHGPLRIAVAADHATSSETGLHTADPVPVLLWGDGVEADDVQSYDETAAASGQLQRFPLQVVVEKLFDLA